MDCVTPQPPRRPHGPARLAVMAAVSGLAGASAIGAAATALMTAGARLPGHPGHAAPGLPLALMPAAYAALAGAFILSMSGVLRQRHWAWRVAVSLHAALFLAAMAHVIAFSQIAWFPNPSLNAVAVGTLTVMPAPAPFALIAGAALALLYSPPGRAALRPRSNSIP